ncbi:hypothetical protein NFI96_029317, partial [Prochilodus magdalenae]
GLESWHQLPSEEDSSQFLGHASEGQLSIMGDSRTQRESLQLELQDSRLTPALTLIPKGKNLILSESTILNQTDSEFVPLRCYPDLSIASGRNLFMSHQDVESGFPNVSHELSQHPLGETAAISEGGSSCCSLSQHSLSPSSHNQATQVHDVDQGSVLKNDHERQMEGKKKADADLNTGEAAVCAFSENGAPAHPLLVHLEKDVGVASNSAVSSASETALSQTEDMLTQQHSSQTKLKHIDLTCTSAEEPRSRPSGSREQPQGGSLSSPSSQRKTTGDVVSISSHISSTSNITVRSSSMQPDRTTDPVHGLLLPNSHSEATVSAPGNISQSDTKDTSSVLCVTPASGTSVYVAGLQRVLWGSGSQTAVDGSFLTSQPVSQSTPAMLLNRAPPVTTKLSPLYSQDETIANMAVSIQSNSSKGGQMPTLNLSTRDLNGVPKVTSLDSVEADVPPFHHEVSNTHQASSTRQYVPAPAFANASKDQDSRLSAGRVRSLPTLSYLQKVDAWKANQSSSRSFHDNLGLQGFEGIPLNRTAQDSDVSDGQSLMLTQQSPQHNNRTASEFGTNISSHASQPVLGITDQQGSSSSRHGDVVGAGVAGVPFSASPLVHSRSHSSLSTVVTSIQRDGVQHNTQLPLSPHLRESPLLAKGNESELNLADQPEPGPVKNSALPSLGQFSDVSSNRNIFSALSSSQSSCHGEQSLLASVGAASSVVSLEVDNYAPYWTSRPGSPPHSFEINIEDRIPLYLRNLGIDQSPSTILNPFTPRGPIREPEFSPTDLCTIKGSIGTPTKSTQLSEGESPQKETFSSSSLFSVDSNASLTRRLAVQMPDRPASPGSVRLVRCPVETTGDHYSPPALQESDTPQREGSYGLPAQLSPKPDPNPGAWLKAKEEDSSLVGSGTLQEIRRLLGRAEDLVSGHSSLASSPGSHCYSESDTSYLSLRRNTQTYLDDSSLSVGGKISQVLTRSSSDSALRESSSSSREPLQLSTQTHYLSAEVTTYLQSREENLKSRDLSVAPRRTEPEGCSAADPDKVGTVSQSVMQEDASSASDDNLQSQESAENTGVNSPENSPTRSPAEAELSVLSDNSSESSLAARVAKLLKSESPVSMVTSRPSTTDPEESRAREWIMLKVSGRQCESLELNVEDRKRIEEIKRELLLHTKYTKWSSDSEASVKSSVGAVPEPTVGFTAVRNAEDRISAQLQRATQNPLDCTAPLPTPLYHDLEARVRQIALREGLNTHTPLTSITTSTTCRTPSPQSEIHKGDHMCAASQHDHTHSPTNTLLKSADEGRGQTVMSERETEIEKLGRMKEDKERKCEEEQESETTSQSVIQDVNHKSIICKDDIPPSSDLSFPHKSQMSHIHLTLSPKPQQSITQRLHSPASDVCSSDRLQTSLHTHHSDRLSSEKTLRRDLSSVSSSSEEQHTSASSQTSKSNDRHGGQGQYTGLGSVNSQVSFKYTQAFTLPQRLTGSSRPLSVHTAALLPYKPHGSSELFYMPRTEPELSPVRSDTTMESSHPGSDDAVPPCFTTEILGSRELEDNNITPKHKEGIYSKRARMSRESSDFGRGRLDSKVADSAGSHYQLPASSTSVSPNNQQEAIYNAEQAKEEEVVEEEEEEFAPLHTEADYSTDDLHHQSYNVRRRDLVPEAPALSIKPIREEKQGLKNQELGLEISSSLDHLWRRFSERWSLQETQPTNEAELSLLERLERLSRLLQSSAPPHTSIRREERSKGRRRELEQRGGQGKETSRTGKDKKDRREFRVTPKAAWEENSLRTDQTLEEDEQENAYRCPAERDESASVSVETSSSQSTINTQRLVRAFGPQSVNGGSAEVPRGQIPKASSSMLKLYNTINKQKGGHMSAAREIISTDESTGSGDSLSSSSTYRGTARSLSNKRPKVKLVSKGVQAGDLEIVVNGTRRHTRDVGTIFPSPGNARDTRAPSASAELQASIAASRTYSAASAQFQKVQRREGLHKSNQTNYPNGVSWYVSADEPKQNARKENEPQHELVWPESQSWFEPYVRTQPWRELQREPLRERHIQLEQDIPLELKKLVETSSGKPSALVHLSLQEALELHRPEFVSRSRERMKRLCLLAEERKMQAVFTREREELFNRPVPPQQPTAAPPPMPSKRVIPVKEMVQRSKRIYAQLPEVQKRKLEEKRKAEYRTYRLNAQLFNKKVTNHVLGRRTPWQ